MGHISVFNADGNKIKVTPKFQVGDIVWDAINKSYGVVLNNYPGEEYLGEIRLDSDGNVPTEDCHELGSPGDKGTKKQLIQALTAHRRLMVNWPGKYTPVNY